MGRKAVLVIGMTPVLTKLHLEAGVLPLARAQVREILPFLVLHPCAHQEATWPQGVHSVDGSLDPTPSNEWYLESVVVHRGQKAT